MSLLGHVTQGTTNSGGLTGDRKYALKATATEAGSITSLFCDLQNSGTEIQSFRAGVYADATTLSAAPLIDVSASVVLAGGATRSWVEFTGLAAAIISGNSYWLTLQAGLAGGNASFWYEPGVGSELFATDVFSDGLDASFGPITAQTVNSIAIYASYVPAAGTGSLSSGLSRIATGSVGWK